MASTDPAADDFAYDELAYLEEICTELGLPWEGPPPVERGEREVAPGRVVSYLRWGEGPPEVVLLHGGAQNAHTWDTVVLALRPTACLAIDLPGHGRSGWRDDGAYHPRANADDVAQVVAELAPTAGVVVGMSLGGLTATALAAHHPELVARLVVIDVTPGVNRDKAAEIHAFIEGPQSFPSFAEIFERTVAFNPTRSPSSLRRGIVHNAERLADGSWRWRYDRRRLEADAAPPMAALWDDVSAVRAPLVLVRGALSPVVDDDDVAELRRRQPSARVELVPDAGHSVQGDRPLELARLIREVLATPYG